VTADAPHHRSHDRNEDDVRRSGSIHTRSAWAAMVEPARVENCPFCTVGIRHVSHVPAASVRVGQDYGDAE
jgi:hypothetical protein